CEGVGAPGHRDGAGVAGLAGEDALAADDADDALSEPERHARTLEHRALLDVHLEEAFRQRPPFDELRTPDAAAFLVTEDDGRPAADPTDGLDRGDHAERAVELAAVRHGVEVRAAPDAGIRRAADQVPGGVDLHVEPRVAHPLRRELVRPVLPLAPPDAVRAAAAADRVELVEALVDRHDAIFPSPRGRGRTPAVGFLQTEGVERLRARRDEDALRLEIELERLEPELAAEAGLLVAAERDPRKGGVRHVDPDRPGFDAARDAVAARRIARPHGRHQPVADVVRNANRVLFVLERDHSDDRPEDLLLRDRHGALDLGEHRRRIERSLAVSDLAAGD